MNSPNTTLPVNRRVLARLLYEDAILAAVEKVSASIKGIYKRDELFQRVLERIFEFIPAKRGVVLLSGPKAGDLQPAAFRGGEFPVNSPLPAQVLREGAGILSGALCAPLGESDHGVIYIESGKRDAFTTQHLHLLIAMAAEASHPIDYTGQIERVDRENQEFRNYTFVDRGIVGESAAIREVLDNIEMVAPQDVRVLILGESGTGKDLAARAIHANSARQGGPFVTLNCATIPETLIESELFGHERGAFSGADTLKKGVVEIANGGTLFLDEVGETSPKAQASLLRFTESGEFRRLGSTVTLHSNVRIIAATNRNMPTWIAQKMFREDLYYRLHTVEFHMPPLRERRSDIPLLAKHFLPKFRMSGRSPTGFSADALAALKRYDWPGNVRELHSAIERATIFCKSELIEAYHLPPAITAKKSTKAGATTYKAHMEACGKNLIHTTLIETGGNHAEAARILGMTASGMRRLAGRLGVKLT